MFYKKLIICIFACLMQACTSLKNGPIEEHRPTGTRYNDCYEIGIEKYETDGNFGYVGIVNRLSEINAKCENLVEKFRARVDVPCTVNNFDSKCDDVIMIVRRNTAGYITQTPVTLNAAMRMEWFKTLKDQDELKLVFKENIEGRAVREIEQSRLEKEKQLIAQKQEQERVMAENLKREQDEERRRHEKWLKSPEGRAQTLKEEKDREAFIQHEKEKERKFAIDFPYYALITCGGAVNHILTHACFERGLTSIEVNNGGKYGLYKAHEFGLLGRETNRGFIIDLRSNFSISAQNSSRDLTLGMKIIKKIDESVLFQKQVDRFGIISVKN